MSNQIKDIDDVDDDLFISKRPQNYIFADKKAQDTNDRTNKMLQNTRSLVHESQAVGQSALENLSNQRETLERVENDLDTITSLTRSTQKNLNNMRSFFGGIKSLFSSSSAQKAVPLAVPATKAGVPRSQTMANMPTNSKLGASSSASSTSAHRSSFQQDPAFKHPGAIQSLQPPEDEFEANLSEISFGVGMLKDMAMKLGDEIGDQNDILDRITEKSERAGDSIKVQNRQIQQLLKK